jgi:hypothetical protein
MGLFMVLHWAAIPIVALLVVLMCCAVRNASIGE